MRNITLFLLLLLSTAALAQTERHLVYFKNKPDLSADPSSFLSERAIARRERQQIVLQPRDYPVASAYIDSLKKTGVTVLYTTKWLNGALVSGTAAQMQAVARLSVVKSASKVSRMGAKSQTPAAPLPPTSPQQRTISIPYGASLEQLQMLDVPVMHQEGFFGEGMLVAIMDSGFDQANGTPALDSLFKRGRILGTYDFVDQNANVYDDDDHGTSVLSVMGGYSPGNLIGPAYRAQYWLFRTEDVSSEKLIEEVYWLLAAEKADSAGVDIINTSLGYFDFDDAAYNHSKSEFDGNTTIIARAADFAAASGILVVASAGNEGDGGWNYISTPADGDSVLAVGAVNELGEVAGFSSPGPSADGQIKPDVAGMGVQVIVANAGGGFRPANGTSFAAPLVAAMAAGVWQAFPELSVGELLQALRESGSKAANPDNRVGYGIPSFLKIRKKLNPTGTEQEGPLQGSMLYPNPAFGKVQLQMPVPLLAKASLYSTSGQLLWQEEVKGSQILHFPTALKGMYVLRLVSEEGVKVWKLRLE